MGEELEFRTAVGGYKKDDVLEYVENMNDKLDQMTRAHEEETKGYQNRIKELSIIALPQGMLLKQKVSFLHVIDFFLG